MPRVVVRCAVVAPIRVGMGGRILIAVQEVELAMGHSDATILLPQVTSWHFLVTARNVLRDHLLCVQSRLGSQQTLQVWIANVVQLTAHRPPACIVLQLPIRVQIVQVQHVL